MKGPLRRVVGAMVSATLALTLAGCASDSVPKGSECRNLVKKQAPTLEARALELLDMSRDRVRAWADCDSGGYPSVSVGIDSGLPVIERMTTLGTAVELRDTNCLEHLAPSECDREWRYTPKGADVIYWVSLPRKGEGEFSMSVYYPS